MARTFTLTGIEEGDQVQEIRSALQMAMGKISQDAANQPFPHVDPNSQRGMMNDLFDLFDTAMADFEGQGPPPE